VRAADERAGDERMRAARMAGPDDGLDPLRPATDALASGGVADDLASPSAADALASAVDPAFTAAVARVDRALAAMGAGDAEPFRACWAPDADTTLYGAFGTLERGPEAIGATLDWVGGRFRGGTLTASYEVVHCAGGLGFTVGLERGVLSIDGGSPREIVIRVTHVYRRTGSEWLLVHRHGDHPPTREFRSGADGA
jgi:ketosteroid isomerase-like protein